MNTRPDIAGIWHNAEPWERVFVVVMMIAMAVLSSLA